MTDNSDPAQMPDQLGGQKALRWVEIARPSNQVRGLLLREELTSMGISNEATFLAPTDEGFHEAFESAKKQFDQIRIGPPFGEIVNADQPLTPALTFLLQSADCVVKENGRWYPRSTLVDALVLLAADLKHIDLLQPALIVGTGAAARAAVYALVKIGFTAINLTDKFDERGRESTRTLQRKYFNMRFDYTSYTAITTLPGIHSLVVNTTPHIDTNDLLEDLYYFNFLAPNGVVVDLSLRPTEPQLLKNAREVGARTVPGHELAALSDRIWAHWVAGVELDSASYSQKLKTRLDQSPTEG